MRVGTTTDPQCRNCLQFIEEADHPVLENPENAERRKHFCDERCMDLYVRRECVHCGEPVGVGGVGFHRQAANNPYFDGRIRARFCDDDCRQAWKDTQEVRDSYTPASERDWTPDHEPTTFWEDFKAAPIGITAVLLIFFSPLLGAIALLVVSGWSSVFDVVGLLLIQLIFWISVMLLRI